MKLGFGAVVGLAVIGVVVYLAYRANKAVGSIKGAAAEFIGYTSDQLTHAATLVDPTNQNNIVYTAANGLVRAATGDKNETVGGYIYTKLHPNAAADALAQTPRGGPELLNLPVDVAERLAAGVKADQGAATLGIPERNFNPFANPSAGFVSAFE